MIVAAYIRCSTTEQKIRGLSLDAQKMKLQEYADKNGHIISDFYIDAGVSGRKLIKNRPELQRMINDKEKYDHIIFIKLDRFFRSVAEYHECMKMLKGITWSATEEDYDLTTANGRLLVNMKLTIAELEADQTGERIKLVNEYKIKEGRPLTKMPFYFKTVPADKGKKIELNNHEMLMDIINHFRTFRSLRKTANYLSTKYDVSYSPQYIKRFMKDTRLYGEYKGNPNYFPPHMSKQEWDELQKIIPNQLKMNTYRTYIFKGLLKCNCCGWKMSGQPLNGHKKSVAKGYMCPRARDNIVCENKHSFSEGMIERNLLDRIEHMVDDSKRNPKVTPQKEVIDTKPVEDELKRLNYAWQKGRISVEDYDRKYITLTQQLEKMNNAIAETDEEKIKRVQAIVDSGWRDIYYALDDEHKQAFWHSFIDHIVLDFHNETKIESVILK